MVVERLLVRSIVFGRVVVGLSGVVELERVRCVPSCVWAGQWACIPAASRAAAARGQRRAESPTSPSRRHSAACHPGSLARGHPCCPLFLSFSSYSSGWTSMSVYRPRMDQASLFKHLVVVQGVCDLIGFPSETRRTDYLDRRGGRVAVPIHYSIHLIDPSQRCDSGACCVTFCLRL